MSGSHDPDRRAVLRWMWRIPVIAVVMGGAVGVFRATRLHFGKVDPSRAPSFQDVPPVQVASESEFREPWSTTQFTIAGIPAIALKTPVEVAGAVAHETSWIAAFSRVCTHRGCLVDLSRSPELIALATNYRGNTPALLCPCHLSVFLPTEQGRAVSGPARRPLPRVQLAEIKSEVVATGIESSV